jgi:hypothetical protein
MLKRAFRRRHDSLLLFIVFGLAVAGVGTRFFYSSRTALPVAITSKTTLSKAVLGESYQSNEYRLSVGKIVNHSANSVSGTKQITLDVTIVNTSKQTLQISPGLQMSVIDQRGTVYSMTARYLETGRVVGGPLSPGVSRTENVDFELPTSSSVKQFSFQLDASLPPNILNL